MQNIAVSNIRYELAMTRHNSCTNYIYRFRNQLADLTERVHNVLIRSLRDSLHIHASVLRTLFTSRKTGDVLF